MQRLDQNAAGPGVALAGHHGEGPGQFGPADQGGDPDIGGEQHGAGDGLGKTVESLIGNGTESLNR